MKHTETFNYDEIIGMKFGAVLFGKPKLFSHVYFVDGLLIDTGHSRMRKQVATLTKELPVEQMFITHHHEDHSGNIEVLQQQFRCEVLHLPCAAP
ncbi:MAG: MBL fold metallo-hydrolase [Phaeodactylibacter sp.]|nr:MBL fold metallo-hydrolase [Phaeodactylibacter sp.]